MGRVEPLSVASHRRAGLDPREARRVLILNVRSGSAAAQSRAVARMARSAGAEVIEVGRGTDLQLAVRTRMRSGVRNFIVGGGDGTLRNVAQALAGSDATLGLIPLGTYNRFARDAGLPLHWRDALDVALHGRVTAVDVGCVNGAVFLSAVTFGVHAAMLHERERLRARSGRGVALARAAATALAAFPVSRLRLEIEGRSRNVVTSVFAVSVNRIAFEGGLPRRHTLAGGVLSAWWLTATSRTALALQLGAMLLGRGHADDLVEATATGMIVDVEGTSNGGIDGEATAIRKRLSLRIGERALLVRTN